jgi:hypothetical protein
MTSSIAPSAAWLLGLDLDPSWRRGDALTAPYLLARFPGIMLRFAPLPAVWERRACSAHQQPLEV